MSEEPAKRGITALGGETAPFIYADGVATYGVNAEPYNSNWPPILSLLCLMAAQRQRWS
jgi:hypothetical protein